MSIPSPSFSYGWFVIFSVIISAIMWSMFHQGMSLLKELEKHHLKRKTSTNALRRRNQASASSLMMNTKSFIVGTMIRQIIFLLSLLIEQKKYDQALSYIHTLNTSREETKL